MSHVALPYILVINSGSSSIKFGLFTRDKTQTLIKVVQGTIENTGAHPHFFAKNNQNHLLAEHQWQQASDYDELLIYLINWIEAYLQPHQLTAIGHRVVHGGLSYLGPQLITEQVVAQLRELVPLAPLHQPKNLMAIDLLIKRYPKLSQVACFDTAFHATNSRISRLYGLPIEFAEQGIMRFGFHGLSYEYIAQQLVSISPQAAGGRMIVAHLGSGASLCALVKGKSVATTMGFSTLDGLLMSTRCGALDPAVILYCLKEKNMTVEAIENLLYQQSGLLGVSGISGDMHELLASDNAQAKEAIDLFIYRITREIGSLVAVMGGLDALVFTAGIGESAAEIRAKICEQSAWLGICLAPELNNKNACCISLPDSSISVWVIPTDEEQMIAQHALALIKIED